MTKKIFLGFVGFIVCDLFVATQAIAQAVKVENPPRPFTVVSPTSWVRQPTTTGNSRIKFVAPLGTPAAECAVIVKEYPGLRGEQQSTFDQQMAEQPNPSEMTSQLSSRYNNVKVFSTGVASISGFPAQLVNVQYSVGTPRGELWARGITVTTATTPGLVWTITCGALGKSLDEAQKGFSYWQSEIMRFPTNIKIRKQ
jgi:hypothetical protein